MSYTDKVNDIQPRGDGEGHYHDGFYHARDEAWDLAHEADRLIQTLFDALCDRHADDLVDELKERFKYDN